MHDTVRLGRVAGIKVGVHWSVLGMGVLITVVLAQGVLPLAFPTYGWADRWGAAAAGSVVFALSLLAHELGHAVVARRHGVGVAGITLWLLGGVARLTRQAPTPRAEFQIAAAGPLASTAVGVVLVAVALLGADAGWSPLGRAVLLWVGVVNLVLAVFNLLPGAPLDGGRVLTAALWRRSGDAEWARVLAGRSGLVLGALLLALGAVELLRWQRLGGLGTAAIGVFLLGAARGEIAAAVVRARLHRATMASVMAPHPPAVAAGTSVDRFLRWAGDDPTGVPVVHWDHQPVGWVSPALAARCEGPERSWTRVDQVMVPDRLAPRAWSTERLDEVMARLGEDLAPVVVVLDPRTGTTVGTVTPAHLSPLYHGPDVWGRDRPSGQEPASPQPSLR